MGWANYIVVPSYKLAFQVSRHTEGLDSFEEETLENIIGLSEFEEERVDFRDKKLKKDNEGKLNLSLNIRQLHTLLDAYSHVEQLKSMGSDKLLMYWLKKNRIDYEIISEYALAEKKEDYKGWTIVRPGDEAEE
ncbi:hypothetical protein JXB28_03045 [Candidatus Woesearchaeota archaeon]|nr:hypothetical protein [Candidatus Woesearchaeota archaeon]